MKKTDMVAEIARQTAQAWEKLHRVEYETCPVCEAYEEYRYFEQTNLRYRNALREWSTLHELCKTLGIEYDEEKSKTQITKYMDKLWNEKQLFAHK